MRRETGVTIKSSCQNLQSMFLNLQHKTLHVYAAVRELVKEIYMVSKLLPAEERFNMVSQIRRASLSVKLNLAEGASRRERNRYYEIARGSVVEIDAALETAADVEYLTETQLQTTGELLNKCFAMLSNMIV